MKYKILDSRISWCFHRTEANLNYTIELSPKEIPIYYYNQVEKDPYRFYSDELPKSKPIGKVSNLELIIADDIYRTKAIYADVHFYEHDNIKRKLLNNDFGSKLDSITISPDLKFKRKFDEKILFVIFGPKERYRC